MIHLTMRALVWLRGLPAVSAPIATPACTELGENPVRPGNGRDWCRTEDARAIVRGWQYTYLRTRWGTEKREITAPTCPSCCVLFDQAVELSRRFLENKECKNA